MKNCTQLGTQNRHPLHPNRRDVKELQVGIRDNFRLDRFLERSTARCRRPNRGISSSKTYPIGEAIHCGMMSNLRCAIETTEKVDCEGFRFSPMSSRGTPSSTSFHRINRANARVSVYNPIRKPMVQVENLPSRTSSIDKDVASRNLPGRKRMKISIH